MRDRSAFCVACVPCVARCPAMGCGCAGRVLLVSACRFRRIRDSQSQFAPESNERSLLEQCMCQLLCE
eukprot:11269020-Alexandrium_andersonii.AAC.1